MIQTHQLKTVQPFFNLVKSGKKKFELRKNDRNYKQGDLLILREYDPSKQLYMGNSVVVQVNYILDQFVGLSDGYVIMSISEPLAHQSI